MDFTKTDLFISRQIDFPSPFIQKTVKMSTCQAITRANQPCPCMARIGHATCGRHKNVVVAVVVDTVTLCSEFKLNGIRCSKQCALDDTMCVFHRTNTNRRVESDNAARVWRDVHRLLWRGNPLITFEGNASIIYDAFNAGFINLVTLDRLLGLLRDQWGFYLQVQHQAQQVAIVSAASDLQVLALDKQNIHTKAVNALASISMKFLLDTLVPEDQDTLTELETAWSSKDKKKVLKDIGKWYGMETCVTESDWLYKRMLDGLWVFIKQHKEIDELVERLWEEASESVGLCCQGHISRLANVLVGFTEEVKAEVSVGEILQQRMSVISAKDIELEDKVSEAHAVFEELNIPIENRDVWIAAL